MRALLPFVIALLSVLWPGGWGRAEPPAEVVRSPFWESFTRPAYARAEQLLRQGRAQLHPALGLGLLLGAEVSLQRQLALENALTRFERAVALAPDHREARLLYGRTLALSAEPTEAAPRPSRSELAVAQFTALRALDPWYEADEVAFQLGILYTRQGDFARARAEYEHALAVESGDERRATVLANLAEVTMMSGDLVRALALYERAAREGDESSRPLALWGAAVALDRLGERGAALEQAKRAIQEDRAPLDALRRAGVFFVPEHERYYYEGLAQLALAERERAPGESLAQLIARSRAWLSQPTQQPWLLPLEGVLAELAQSGFSELVAPWRARTARVPRQRRGPPGQLQEPAQPSAREARAMSWALQALASFARYLRDDGGAGPFAPDAQRHVSELNRLLR